MTKILTVAEQKIADRNAAQDAAYESASAAFDRQVAVESAEYRRQLAADFTAQLLSEDD